MDVYRTIIKDIKKSFINKGNAKTAKKVKPIMDRYLELVLDGLFHRFKFTGPATSHFSIRMYPMAYISYRLAKVSVFSRRYPYYLFKIFFSWDKMRENSFTFKPMKKFHNKFQEQVLDTEKVYKIIENYEKIII